MYIYPNQKPSTPSTKPNHTRNAATKGVIVEDGLHSLDGDDPQPSPAALLELMADAVETFATAAAPQLAEHQPDLVPALRAVLHEAPPSTTKGSDGAKGSSHGHGQQSSTSALVPPSLPGHSSSSSTLTRATSCNSSSPQGPSDDKQEPPAVLQAPRQLQEQLRPEDVVERCFEAALELSMALPNDVPSPLVDLTPRPASPPPLSNAGGRNTTTGGVGGPSVMEQCRLHVEVCKYNEMKRRHDRDGAAAAAAAAPAAPGSYVPMTGPMEAARSAAALEAMLRLLAAHTDVVSWGWCTPDLAVLSPKARMQRRASQRLQRRLEWALDERGQEDGGDVGVGCLGDEGGGCCAVS